jgi:hypothetical protein
MQFFQVAAIITVMLIVSDQTLGFFALPLAGINPQTSSTATPSLSDLNKTKIEQTATTPSAPTADIAVLSFLSEAIKNSGNTQRVVTYTFGLVDPTTATDFAETMGVFLNGILALFFYLGLAYVPIAVVAAFLGGGAP